MPSVTLSVRRPAAALVLALAGAMALAACGGSAATPAPATSAPATQAVTAAPATEAPTATPAPTPSPTEAPTPTPDPTADPSAGPTGNPAELGGFAFKPGDVLDYYVSQDFTCEEPKPSTVAKGYTTVRCIKTQDSGSYALLTIAVSADGVTGDAYAGYINSAGSPRPDPKESAVFLGGFVAAMLGTSLGTEAATWVATNLEAVDLQSTFGGISSIVYQEDDAGGVGPYVELANDAYLNAPAP